MTSVAEPSSFGASTSSVTLTTASRSTQATPPFSGASRAARRRVEVLKSFERASGRPAAPKPRPKPVRGSSEDGRTTSSTSSTVSVPGGGSRTLMPPPPR